MARSVVVTNYKTTIAISVKRHSLTQVKLAELYKQLTTVTTFTYISTNRPGSVVLYD